MGQVRRHGGFTLVEMLVALSVMALLALMSWRGLDAMVGAQQVNQRRSTELQNLQAGLDQWTTDLDMLTETATVSALHWDGRVVRLTRRSNTLPSETLVVIAWSSRPAGTVTQWMRWQSPTVRTRQELIDAWDQAARWSVSEGLTDPQHEVAVTPVTGLRVHFFRNGAWTEAGPVPGAGGESAVPLGVRLMVTLPAGNGLEGTVTSDWANPLASTGKS